MPLRACLVALATLLLLIGTDFLPRFVPPGTTYRVAQTQHRIDLRTRPMHPGAFQARFDNEFVTTLDTATADGPAVRLKLRILHHCRAFFQVGQRFSEFQLFGMGVHLGLQFR